MCTYVCSYMQLLLVFRFVNKQYRLTKQLTVFRFVKQSSPVENFPCSALAPSVGLQGHNEEEGRQVELSLLAG